MGSVSVRESENTTTRDMPGSRSLEYMSQALNDHHRTFWEDYSRKYSYSGSIETILQEHLQDMSPGYYGPRRAMRGVSLHGGSCWNGELALKHRDSAGWVEYTQQDGWNPLSRMGGIHSAGWVESTQQDGWIFV